MERYKVKVLFRVLLTLFLFPSYSSFAEDSNSQKYIASLLHGDPLVLEHVAKILFKEKIYDIALLDVLAETILRDHQTTDNKIADIVAWELKALGASKNPRYRTIVKEIRKAARHKKVSKYALRASRGLSKRKVEQYVKGAISLEKMKLQYEPVEYGLFEAVKRVTTSKPSQQSYISSLIYGDAELVAYTAQLIYGNREKDSLVLDVLAERILRDYKNLDDAIENAVMWGCRALGATRNYRYRSTLRELRYKSRNGKIKRRAVAALLKLPRNKSQQYIFGQLSLEAMKLKYLEVDKIIVPVSRYRKAVANDSTSNPEYSTLVILRSKLMKPYSYKPKITINGHQAFYLRRGCRVDVKLLPGEYSVEADWGKWQNSKDDSGVSIKLGAGETVYVRNGTSVIGNGSKLKRCNDFSPTWFIRNSFIPGPLRKDFNDDVIIADMVHGDIREKKRASTFVIENSAYTDKVLEAAKSEVSKYYLQPFTYHVNRKLIISLCRILAQSQRLEYKDFLISVRDNAHSEKIRNYAKAYLVDYMNF